MTTPSFKEDHISQIPAIQLLVNLGYTYLSPDEALALRGGKTSNVILEPILLQQLKKINSIHYKGDNYDFNEGNITTGINALYNAPLQEGLVSANEYIYDIITLGKSVEQSIKGDKKSYNLRYIDWDNIENNVFHLTEEFSVMRSTSKDTYRPDIVLFINGIPLVIIECKRPDHKENIEQAISQHLRNQQDDGIKDLFVYSQLLLSVATNVASYGTTCTAPKFWSQWREKHDSNQSEKAYAKTLKKIKNTTQPNDVKDKLFGADRYRYVRKYFDELEQEEIAVTVQDKYLYNLCRPGRLIQLIHDYTIFDAGVKKVARYQQYFAIEKTRKRIATIGADGKRLGGVIWHTQGSGKSLTMVMLAQAIAMHPDIRNPKIVIVTDRVDLDDQIYGTFKKCDLPVLQADSGKQLVEYLESKSDAVVTTIINKFEAAVKRRKKPFQSANIFVLIDEGHRTQYGEFNVNMQKAFPNACFIAFTGTPLRKKEKDTASKFGGLIDSYTVDQAVKDKAVVPLLYEGRHALQEINEDPINTYFDMVSEPLTPYQRSDMKKKYSQGGYLNKVEQKVYAIAWDISRHYRDNWQGTGFKGQLVCEDKRSAIRYYDFLNEIGLISCELVLSKPDTREGEESAYGGAPKKVIQFYKKMMEEHGTQKKYEKNVITRFKYQDEPEIIIVADKLLTGFDAPNNVVLYLTRNLTEHTLLQAIARVNRVAPGKDYGYIVDYFGVLEQLDEALKNYSSYKDFDTADLDLTVTNVHEELQKLPQMHSELWDIFKTVKNKYDETAYEKLLADDAIRVEYYDKLSAYARTMKLALSTFDWHKKVGEEKVNKYKFDLGFFSKLRLSVKNIYSDTVDFKAYEKQIQNLLDKHVVSHEVKPITELVNIFETEKFEKEVAKISSTSSKADMIASRTEKHITERMLEDENLYRRFSEMLQNAIWDYRNKRITEAEYLKRVTEIKNNVLKRTRNDLPEVLNERLVAQAFYGLTLATFEDKIEDEATRKSISADTGIGIDNIIQEHILDNGVAKVDWINKSNLIGQLEISLGDFIMDEIRDKYDMNVSFGEISEMVEKYIEIAKLRYK